MKRNSVRFVMTIGLAAAALSIAATASANLYSNAGGYGSTAIGLSTGSTSANGAAAPTGFVWSELQSEGGFTNATAGIAASGGADPAGLRIADDFTVNDAGGWTISSISLFGYVTNSAAGSNPYSNITLRIWNGRPGDAGSTVIFGDLSNLISQTTVTNTNIYRIFNSAPGTNRIVRQLTVNLTGLTLGQGTYWLDFSNNGGFIPAITAPGLRSGGVNGNAVQQNAGAWAGIVDTGTPTGGPAVAQDVPFIINGIPAPGAIALLGMAGLVGRRRR